MKTLLSANTQTFGEPSFYQLICYTQIRKNDYYPIITRDCYLVIYKPNILQDPNLKPICRFYDSGVRKYLIDDCEYATCDINKRELNSISRHNHEIGKINNYELIQWWLGNICNPNKMPQDMRPLFDNTILSVVGQLESSAEDCKTDCIYKI
jgi:hypothetical protein